MNTYMLTTLSLAVSAKNRTTVHASPLLLCSAIVLFISLIYVLSASGQTRPEQVAEPVIDLTRAVVVSPSNLTGPESKALVMLIEEVEKRTQVRWPRASQWPTDETPVIAVGPATALKGFAGKYLSQLVSERSGTGREGYRIRIERVRSAPTVFIIGNDSRGVLFGIGHLLRTLRMAKGKITLPENFSVATTPRFAVTS